MVDDGGCSGVVVVACTAAAFLVSVTEKFELEGRTAAAVGREGDDFSGLVRTDIFSGLGADVP